MLKEVNFYWNMIPMQKVRLQTYNYKSKFIFIILVKIAANSKSYANTNFYSNTGNVYNKDKNERIMSFKKTSYN